MTREELSERLWDFAARVAKVVDVLPETRVGRHVAGQLVRCGTAPAPNYDEACNAESRADFVRKLKIALKELAEARGWLRFIGKAELLPFPRFVELIEECEQICRILGRSVSTAKSPSDVQANLLHDDSSITNYQLPITNHKSSISINENRHFTENRQEELVEGALDEAK